MKITKSIIGPGLILALSILSTTLHAQTGVEWNPNANPTQPSDLLWSTAANWNGGVVPVSTYKAFVKGPTCIVDSSAGGCQIAVGDGGAGVLIITNGGTLASGDTALGNNDLYAWTGCGWGNGDNGQIIVEAGGSITFGYHLWIGMNTGAHGELIMHGGNATVTAAFGLGASGGVGIAHLNGGTLELLQANIICPNANGSLIDVAGGTMIIPGDYTGALTTLQGAGKLTAYAGTGTLNVDFNNINPGKTTVTATAPGGGGPAAANIRIDSVSGGTVTLKYVTTPGFQYHVESTASFSPTNWVSEAGSTINAAGAEQTFSLPVSGDTRYYRAVSP